MLTLGDIKAGLQARGYGADTTTAQTEFVKAALRRVWGMRRWSFMQSVNTNIVTTASLNEYSLDSISLLTGVDAVRLHDGPTGTEDLVTLQFEPVEELTDRIACEPASGMPELWSLRGSNVVLYPTPDQAYRLDIEVFALPLVPTTDSDQVNFPEQHIEVIVEYATMMMAKRQRDWQMYNAAKADYQEALTDMLRDRNLVQRQTAAMVQRWSGWDEVAR